MIRAIYFENAGPFRGRHVVRLGPKAYAVTCRYEDDPGRSNWGGKSLLLELVDLAAFGRLKKSRRYDADGWITDGEKFGLTGFVLEDGAAVLRSRRRGKATQIRYVPSLAPEDEDEFFNVVGQDASVEGLRGVAAQADAEAALAKHLRFTKDDFVNIAYFESKQAARLVHTDPGPRETIVSGWLGTQRAEAAEDRAAEEAAELAAESKKLRDRLGFLSERRTAIPREQIEAERDAAASRAKEAKKEVERLRALVQEARVDREYYVGAQAAVREYDRLVSEGTKLAEEVDKIDPRLEERVKRIDEEWELARKLSIEAEGEVMRREEVAKGEFDGRCPIADIECPARKQINENRKPALAALKVAKEQAEILGKQASETGRVKKKLETMEAEADQKRRSLEYARNRARELLKGIKPARELLKKPMPEADGLEEKLEAARTELASAERHRDDATRALASRDEVEKEVLEIERKIAELGERTRKALRARACLRSALRRVSEGALARIGQRATSMLADAGVALEIDTRWDYEGKDPAKSCEECGAAFPASAKVKACATCGADRGMNIIRKLEFLRSDQSDAADDLSGIALQLAAGSWVLRRRASPWATALLDEPLAACDKTNRKAFAAAFVRLLGSGVWRQSLVISHSGDTVDAFPARIEIVVGRDGERRILQHG